MTTKSAVAQMIVAQYARDVSGDGANEHEPIAPPEARQEESQGVNPDETLDEMTVIEFDSKATADAVRSNFTEYLSDDDDKRMTEVRIAEGTPIEVVEDLRGIRDSND